MLFVRTLITKWWTELPNTNMVCTRTTDTRRLNFKLFAVQIQIPLPNEYMWVGYKSLVFCRNNGWMIKNMDKVLTLPKWVLIVRPKILQRPQKCFSQNVCQSPKVRDFWKKLTQVSVVRGLYVAALKTLKAPFLHSESNRCSIQLFLTKTFLLLFCFCNSFT
jgi:hypothetical protein